MKDFANLKYMQLKIISDAYVRAIGSEFQLADWIPYKMEEPPMCRQVAVTYSSEISVNVKFSKLKAEAARIAEISSLKQRKCI